MPYGKTSSGKMKKFPYTVKGIADAKKAGIKPKRKKLSIKKK